MDALDEITKFLQLGTRVDLKSETLKHILGLTGSQEGIDSLLHRPKILTALLSLLHDRTPAIQRNALFSLLNLSSYERAAEALVAIDPKEHPQPLQSSPDRLVPTMLKFALDPECPFAAICCMILSNVSLPDTLVDEIVEQVENGTIGFDDVVTAFAKEKYNKHNEELHHLGQMLTNLSRSRKMRNFILSRDKCVVQRLLPFITYEKSLVRRQGVVGTLKNCCFDVEHHSWLLSEDVDLLPRLLLPLAGPEEFDEEDNDKLPLDLQYLSSEKKREDDPEIRRMLLQAISLLCTKRENRQQVRDKNTYVILRELHKWEKDRQVLLECENLVDLMIRTEEEIGEEDLSKVDVPEHLANDFAKEDQQFLKDTDA